MIRYTEVKRMGASETFTSDAGGVAQASMHQISVSSDGATEGKLSLLVKPIGAKAFESATIDGEPVIFSFVDLKSITGAECIVDSWKLVPSGLDGGYIVSLAGWD